MRPTRRVVSLFVLTGLLSLGVVPVAFASEVEAPAVVDAELPLDEVPLGDLEPEASSASADAPATRTASFTAPIEFTGLWAELPTGLDAVRVRTSVDGQDWTPWYPLELQDALDAPDPGSAEAAAATDATRLTDMLSTLEGRHVQVEADVADVDELAEVTLGFVDAAGLNESVPARLVRYLTPRPVPAEAATVPSWVKPRSEWGAKPYKGSPAVAKNGVEQVVVHHTAGANNLEVGGSCDPAKVKATMRGVQYHHQVNNGWSDIGYNVVIDPCGGVWEARQGGMDRAVIGAHAAGANTGSTGVSVLGNYVDRTPSETILAALDRVVGWKAGIHGIDTTGTVTRTIKGTTKTYPTVVGHTTVGNTSCPGRIMNAMGRIRTNAKELAGGWERVPDGLGASAFTDTAGNTHAEAIEALVERKITEGYADGSFRPHLDVTRAQVATFLMRALELDPVPGDRFADVDAGNVHAPAINALVDAGVLNGYGGDTFRPNESLRREHMAVVLARALALDLDPDAAATFSDVVLYPGEIGALATAKVTSGYGDGTFKPKASVNRAQMATFLMNAVRLLDERTTAEDDGDEPDEGDASEPDPAATPAP